LGGNRGNKRSNSFAKRESGTELRLPQGATKTEAAMDRRLVAGSILFIASRAGTVNDFAVTGLDLGQRPVDFPRYLLRGGLPIKAGGYAYIFNVKPVLIEETALQQIKLSHFVSPAHFPDAIGTRSRRQRSVRRLP